MLAQLLKWMNLQTLYRFVWIAERKRCYMPISSTVDMAMVPPELMGKFNLIFYQSPEDSVFKSLGVE